MTTKARTTTSTRAPEIPTTMRAAAIDRFGPPEVLTPHTLPVPDIGDDEVLIRIHTAGVGTWDASIRDGEWDEGDHDFPRVLGVDGAGTVVARGADVTRFHVGDRVWSYDFETPNGGFYAEYVAVSAEHAGLIPEQLDLREAGAAAVTGLTALQGIDDHLQVKSGHTVLVFGATGAVGTLAVQFAKRHGARVVATASGGPARTLLQRLGVDTIFDARSSAELGALAEFVPEGFHRVLALAGGDELTTCLELVRSRGRVAFPNGVEPKPRRSRRYHLIGYDAEVTSRHFDRLAAAATDAALRVPIADRYPLDRAADAHRRLTEGVVGRIVLDVERS